MGGSAAVSVLLIGAIPDRLEATVALIVFALATAVSMSIVSAGFGALTVSRWLTDQLEAAVPMLGLFSLLFGVFYALSAVALA
jgi:hypothetical protein